MEQPSVAGDLAREVRVGCVGMRVTRLHRVVGRIYEQELRAEGVSLPQMEILADLVTCAGPVRPAALATRLMTERSTLSRNLALMQERGWIAAVETSPTGRAMSVTIAAPGIAVFESASSAWRGAQASVLGMLGPDAAATLDRWLGRCPGARAVEDPGTP